MNKSSDSPPSLLFNLVVYHFACRLFLIMEPYTVCCCRLIVECAVASSDIIKWQLEIWKVILSFNIFFYRHGFFFFLSLHLSVNDKYRFGPNRLWGLVLSSGRGGCQGARKCRPASRNCQWKCSHQINLSWASRDQRFWMWECERNSQHYTALLRCAGWAASEIMFKVD